MQWSQSGRLALTVGKQGVPFTQEGATSSRELLTIDRSNLANNIWFGQEYHAWRPACRGRLRHGTTGWASTPLARPRGSFRQFNGGVFTLGVLGYDFAKKIGVRQALLTGNYLYQQPDADNTFTRRFEHITSIHFRFEEPKWGVRTDVSRAIGYLGQSNLWSFMALPTINATEKLQFVAGYTLVRSDDPKGVTHYHITTGSSAAAVTRTTSGMPAPITTFTDTD